LAENGLGFTLGDFCHPEFQLRKSETLWRQKTDSGLQTGWPDVFRVKIAQIASKKPKL
jgi:hypothetical protein